MLDLEGDRGLLNLSFHIPIITIYMFYIQSIAMCYIFIADDRGQTVFLFSTEYESLGLDYLIIV